MNRFIDDIHNKLEHYNLNQEFDINTCTYISHEKAVIFSPFTQETLLCEHIIVDILVLFKNKTSLALNVSAKEKLSRYFNEIIEKLLSMKIIFAKE